MQDECFPCQLQQVLNTAEASGATPEQKELIIRKHLDFLSGADYSLSPADIGAGVYHIVRNVTGNEDPYRREKKHFNDQALAMLDELRRKVMDSEHPVRTAARLAVAGNVIDFGIGSHNDTGQLDLAGQVETIDGAKFAVDDSDQLAEELSSAGSILYIADNAGEIVLDRLLIEVAGPEKVTLVVRKKAIINDATRLDARQAGLDGLVAHVMDAGSDAAGAVPRLFSDNMRRLFNKSDVVIAKGQGNFETLHGRETRARWHLFKVKCPAAARCSGFKQGSFLITRLSD